MINVMLSMLRLISFNPHKAWQVSWGVVYTDFYIEEKQKLEAGMIRSFVDAPLPIRGIVDLGLCDSAA